MFQSNVQYLRNNNKELIRVIEIAIFLLLYTDIDKKRKDRSERST